MFRAVSIFLTAIALLGAGVAGAAEVALTIGKVGRGAQTDLTLSDLSALGEVTIVTGNDFVDGQRNFRGPLMRDLLQHYGAGGAEKVRLTAVNDYHVDVAVSEFYAYDVILALTVDGKPLSRRDRGPIWLIYPTDDHQELQDPVYNGRLIWQLVKVEFW